MIDKPASRTRLNTRLNRTGTRAFARFAIPIAAVLALAACGPESVPAGDELSEADKSRIAESWRDCLAEDGIRGEIDYSNGLDIGVDIPQGVSEEQVQATEARCEPILNDLDAGPELSPEQEAEMADVLLEVQRCMADAGYVISIDGGGISVNSDDQPADYDEAAYAEAEDNCFRTVAPDLYEESGG